MKVTQIKYIPTGQITEHLNKNKPRPEFNPEYSVCMVNVDNMISLETNDFCTKLCGSKLYSLRFGSDISFIVEEDSYNKICSIFMRSNSYYVNQ